MSGRGRGRGAYFKALYGGRGRGRGGTGGGDAHDRPHPPAAVAAGSAPLSSDLATDGRPYPAYRRDLERTPASASDLAAALRELEGRPYPAYRDLERTAFAFPAGWSVTLDKAQADPYAPPSRLVVAVPAGLAGLPRHALSSAARVIATADFLARHLGEAVDAANASSRAANTGDGGAGWGGDKGGDLGVSAPGAAVLPQTAVVIHPDGAVEARLTVALPARGRSIRGAAAAAALTVALPSAVEAALVRAGKSHGPDLAAHADAVEDAATLRARMPSLGLMAFIADGSVLPRATGAHDAPLPSPPAVPFVAPTDSPHTITVDLPHAGRVRGLGIPRGVIAVTGGGFHGKSTLLAAIAAGVYNHPPGDGRALCVTDAGAVVVRAEDGRRVTHVDISGLIDPSRLPGGSGTDRTTNPAFSTEDASGSTSQAAAVFEALEVGATALILDEDASAANLLARDAVMARLVPPGDEPITGLASRARELSRRAGVSVVIALGASGAWLGVADAVVRMRDYAPSDVTAEARALVAAAAGEEAYPGPPPLPLPLPLTPRVPVSIHPDARGGRLKWGATVGRAGGGPAVAQSLRVGDETIPLAGLPQVVSPGQARGLAAALAVLADRVTCAARGGGRVALADLLDALDRDMDADLSATLCPHWRAGDLARPRRFEIAAALNRLHTLEVARGV